MDRQLMLCRVFVCVVPFVIAICPPQSHGQNAGAIALHKLQSGHSINFSGDSSRESETRTPGRTIPAQWIQDLVVDEVVKLPIDIEGAIIDGPLKLESVIFKANVSFRDCVFTKSVDLHSATFEGSALFYGSRFSENADFRGTHAKRDFRITRAIFHGNASFQDVRIDEQLNANGAHFDAGANFVRAEINKSAFFSGGEAGNQTEFRGPAKFQGMRVHGVANFKGSRFYEDAVFQNIQVEGSAFFDEGAEFKCKADFTLTHIYENAIFLGTRFSDDVSFDWIRIDGAASFWEQNGKAAEFWGAVSFSSAIIGSDATFIGTYFAHRASFDEVDFKGSAEFKSVQFKEEADLTGARFSKSLFFTDAKFWGPADFSLVIGRDVHFSNAQFRKRVSFREGRFQILYFGDPPVSTPNMSPNRAFVQLAVQASFFEAVDLGGLTYDRVYGNMADILKRMVPFERQPYVQLEQYLRKIGADDDADAVYLERKTEERRQMSFWRHPAACLGDLLYSYAANYGILDWRLFAWTVLFLAFGSWLFSRPGTVELKKEVCQVANFISLPANVPAITRSSVPGTGLAVAAVSQPVAALSLTWRQALAFSFHEFLPLSVPVGEKWVATSAIVPVKIPRIQWPFSISSSGYSTFLRAAGWIIVPVAVAALTGLLRRAGS